MDKARKTAEPVAGFEGRFARVEQDRAAQFAKIEQRFVQIEGELNVMKWMLGVAIAGVAALILKAFF